MTFRKYLSKPVVAGIAILAVIFAVEMYQAHRQKQQGNATAEDNQHWKKAGALRERGKHGEAISEYLQALRTLSYNSILRQELAYELQVIGNDDDAAVQLHEVISIDKGSNVDDFDAEVHIDLARILEKKGDSTGALKECRLAEEIHPDVYFYHTECERLSNRPKP